MSEKELRDIPYAYTGADWMCMCCYVYGDDQASIEHKKDCLLSADPDAVAILHRWKEEAKKDVLMAAVQDRLENIVLDETGSASPTTGGSGWKERQRMEKIELPKAAQLILNGHNKQVKKAERPLAELLMKMVAECEGKKGEERAGLMNFHWMEIVSLLRKAAAIAYMEAVFDMEGEDE